MVKILLDTSVLVELLEQGPRFPLLKAIAKKFPSDTIELYSSISFFELCFGAYTKESVVEKFLSALRSVPLNDAIAKRAGHLLRTRFSKNRRHIPDALIAASTIEEQSFLWTLNVKDFSRIPSLNIFSLHLPELA